MNETVDQAPMHLMRLDPEPFAKIESGEKTVELRLYDEKRRAINPGDWAVFTRNGEAGTLLVRVIGVCRFRSFEELFCHIPPSVCGFEGHESPEECAEAMKRYYTKEDQKKYGVVALVIRNVPKISGKYLQNT